MTTLVTLTILLVPAAATRTAGASSPTERNWEASYGYMKQIARKQHLRADDLQRRLTRRVLEVRSLRRQLLSFHRRFKAAPNRPPHYNEWLCIHGGEGAWQSNTGNGYYGGLQFAQSTWDRNGGQKYASRADLASPLEQMWVAESAWRESGGSFAQWPNTARACGLL